MVCESGFRWEGFASPIQARNRVQAKMQFLIAVNTVAAGMFSIIISVVNVTVLTALNLSVPLKNAFCEIIGDLNVQL